MSSTPSSGDQGSGREPLGDMPAGIFREAGYRIIDRIADYLESGPGAPVLPRIEPGEISARLPGSAPAGGRTIEALLEDFDEILYPGFTHWNSPRFMAYFPSSASGPAILGDLLATAMTQNVMLWRTGPAGTELELRVPVHLVQPLFEPVDVWELVGRQGRRTGPASARFHGEAPDLGHRVPHRVPG